MTTEVIDWAYSEDEAKQLTDAYNSNMGLNLEISYELETN